MFIIGIILAVIGILVLVDAIIEGASERFLEETGAVFLIALGILLVYYDASSPMVEYKQETIVSSKLNNIVFSEPMKIKIIYKKPSRKLVLLKQRTETYEVEPFDGDISNVNKIILNNGEEK